MSAKTDAMIDEAAKMEDNEFVDLISWCIFEACRRMQEQSNGALFDDITGKVEYLTGDDAPIFFVDVVGAYSYSD